MVGLKHPTIPAIIDYEASFDSIPHHSDPSMHEVS